MIPETSVDDGVNTTLDMFTTFIMNKWVLYFLVIFGVVWLIHWAWQRPMWRGGIIGILIMAIVITLITGL